MSSGSYWWEPVPQGGHVPSLKVFDEDGLICDYIPASTIFAGGNLTPIGYAAALYLKDCIVNKRVP